MGYTEKERVQVKMEFLRMIARMELDPAKMELIYGYFETYLKLTETEEKQMREVVKRLAAKEVDRLLEIAELLLKSGNGRSEGINSL